MVVQRVDGDVQPAERRRPRNTVQSPDDALDQMPASTLLERMSAPVLVVGDDGRVVFANTAFCDMLGYPRDAMSTLNALQIFCTADGRTARNLPDWRIEKLVHLKHRERYVVHARMGASALRRDDDPIALLTFNDMQEQMWNTSRSVRHGI